MGVLLSLVVPVYNRPDEMKELLESLSLQTNNDFELVVVEDGSKLSSEDVIKEYQDRIDIKYYYKENSGPGMTRNYGSERVNGEYIIYLDSDCVIPPQYIEVLHNFLKDNKVDWFGGPDGASKDFSAFQKAVSYSMTSFFTTGGIRGGKRKMDKFYPRSFNMGYSKSAYDKFGGFLAIRHGEDTELSYRLERGGCRSVFIPEAYVFHKRRSTLKSFRRQVFYFGLARVNLSIRYPKSMKLVHLLPMFFLFYLIATFIVATTPCLYALLPIAAIVLIWFLDSTLRNHSIKVGLISVVSSFTQLTSYGCGMLYGFWMRYILRKTEADTYNY